MNIAKCLRCNKEFNKRSNKNRPNKYCSMHCYNKCKTGPSKFYETATYDQILDRLKFYYEKRVIRKDGCWDFNGCRGRGGYALMSIAGKSKSASRVSWMIHNGPIPESLFVLHKCDNPPCTNPEHLFLGTTKQNAQDRSIKGRNSNQNGENNHSAKLIASQVVEIRELCKIMPIQEIANKFNVAIGTINSIKYRQNWRHI